MSGMRKRIQAKHVSDVEFLAVIHNAKLANGRSLWTFWWDFMPYYEMKGVPHKVVFAKARALQRRGLIGACVHDGNYAHQCRGDLELTDKGAAALADYMAVALERRNTMASLVGSSNG